MNRNKKPCLRFWLLLLVSVFSLTGCVAGQASFTKGNQAMEQQSYDQAVVEYLSAVESSPGNYEYRLRLNVARNKSALDHKAQGDQFFSQGQYVGALQEYRQAAELDGSLYAAFDGLKRAQKYFQVEKLLQDAELLLQSNRKSQAEDTINKALALAPDHQQALQLKGKIKQSQFALVDGVELEVTSTQPINLNFRDTKLPDVFSILTQLSGINFILDEDVRSSKTTLFLEKATFAQGLELLLRMNKLDKKILNSKTIILYPKTRDKQKQFKDQVIQTFYLSYMDAKKAVNMLRTMLQVRKIYVQEELNAIVVRDQPDVIRLAQKLIEANDRGSSEVIFDLELIEVNHDNKLDLGLKLSDNAIGAGLSILGSERIVDTAVGSVTTNLVASSRELNPFDTDLESFYSIPTATFRFMKTQVDAEILASPKIRVRNKEKAKVHVGTREPVITTTTNDGVSSTSVQYIDVGVKLDVEPTIQLDNTVVAKLGLEVSNVTGTAVVSGTTAITISSTNANTTLTLKDGEQTIIGGLIRNDKSTTKIKIPLIGDIPLLGELFTHTDKKKIKREILLSITPHIVKSVAVPQGDIASIWSGGEDDLKFGRNFGTFIDEYRSGQETLEPLTGLKKNEITPEIEPSEPSATVAQPDVSESSIKLADTEPPAIIEKEVKEPQASLPQAGSMVFVEGLQQASQGDDVEVNIIVEGVKELFSAPMTIQYDPALLEFISAEEGTFLKSGSAATVFTHTVLEGKGRIVVGLKQGAAGEGVSGRGELFSLQFKAIKAGDAEVESVQMNFRNKQGDFLATETYGLLLEIAP